MTHRYDTPGKAREHHACEFPVYSEFPEQRFVLGSQPCSAPAVEEVEGMGCCAPHAQEQRAELRQLAAATERALARRRDYERSPAGQREKRQHRRLKRLKKLLPSIEFASDDDWTDNDTVEVDLDELEKCLRRRL